MEHVKFPKIPRAGKGLNIITEKLDGTNGQIHIWNSIDNPGEGKGTHYIPCTVIRVDDPRAGGGKLAQYITAGSRTRWVSPENDNFGFAAWVYKNAEDLVTLGAGTHYGEWYGNGIQRGYGLEEKRFALFNTSRWNPSNPNKPDCCEVVSVLSAGDQTEEECMMILRSKGSVHVPGFDKPEGIVTYSAATRIYTKTTFENSRGKWDK